ncbi:hypothetical protein LI82_05195 [Methanococcoides methylutens]|uniref:Methyltransferase domain-containing protein n=1 Tax=Methanococcoides methylutens TaxID=2226 RepID=A0A099T2P1_METMT|nr:methyltransferase domain-containing protein [Methanococcoides methylutens]KGK99392.1 hypothetical protein LI82_05195 [Methanococcoides methylutens]
MSAKGNDFGTIYGKKNYDIFATLLGFEYSFYERAASEMPIEKGMKVLDLGCSTASLDLEREEKMEHNGKILGIDLSNNQLAYAHSKIKEAFRVLIRGGYFVLIDCARPRFSITSMMLLPFFMFKTNEDNWNNAYVDICEENSMTLKREAYLKSYIRCQIFKKQV